MSAGVKSVEFDSSGGLVWVGDEKVLLPSYPPQTALGSLLSSEYGRFATKSFRYILMSIRYIIQQYCSETTCSEITFFFFFEKTTFI